MKAMSLSFLVVLPLTLIAGDVQRGDRIESVRASLGIERGQMHLGAREVLYFDRGEIELSSGVVTRVALRSLEEQAALETKRSAEAERVRETLAIRRAQLITEGDALKARKLSDPVFLATPLSHQVAFWEDFSRRYADVPSAEPLSLARARLAEQVASNQAQNLRLAELEARVAEAEARTAEANTRKERTRSYAPSHYDSGSYFSSYGRSHRDHYPHRDSRDDRQTTPGQVVIFDAPLPYATTPGMPPMQPKIREIYPVNQTTVDKSTDQDWLGVPRYKPNNRRF